MTTLVMRRMNSKTHYILLKFDNLADALQYASKYLDRLVDVLDEDGNSLYF
jgi:hypothetical protein